MKIPACIFLFSAVATAQRVIETSSFGHGAMYLPTFLTSLHALLELTSDLGWPPAEKASQDGTWEEKDISLRLYVLGPMNYSRGNLILISAALQQSDIDTTVPWQHKRICLGSISVC
jgi:hypothetical protein